MKKIISILIISLALLSATFIAMANVGTGQPNQQTTITLTDMGKGINETNKLIEGSKLTPDCEIPWTIQKQSTSNGLQVIEVNNGKLSFQILPTRGMSIQEVKIGEQNQGWNSPIIGTKPASLVEVVIDRTPPCRITVRGKIDEGTANGPNLTTEISTVPGASTFQLSNIMDFAALDTKTTVSEKPKLTLAEITKSAKTWEPSFTEWFGKPAPDFTITDITGKKQKVSDYRGKNLIINVWATWCPPCRKEIPDFIELRKEIKEDELGIIGISTEDGQESKVKDFVKENKMNYTIAVADFSKLEAPYSKISAIPTTFFIDKEGKIKLATIGVLTLEDAKKILEAK